MRVNANKISRKFYSLNDFRGVDYSSSPLEVKPYRATDMQNFILKDGVLHKRNGWERMLKVSSEKVDGVWIWGKDAIVQCGSTFYKVTDFDTENATTTKINGGKASRKAIAFYSQDKMYFLTGNDYLVYDGNEMDSLVNNRAKAYIPTTMEVNASGVRTAIESANAISAWRKFVFNLDGESQDFADYEIATDKLVEVNERAPLISIYPYDGKGARTITFEKVDNYWYNGTYGVEVTPFAVKFPMNTAPIPELYKARWELTYFPLISESNVPDVSKNITTAKVGAIFGVDGAADRLFLGGSETTPNLVYYSDNTIEHLPDFSYFPVNYFVRCGQSINGVSAVGRISDGTLAVFKDTKSLQEPSVYFVSGITQIKETDDTGASVMEDVFQVRAGNIDERGIASGGIANLAGDSLFVSHSGVYGITLSENVSSSERYAKSRSKVINARLTQYDLSTAKSIVFDNRYYLAVGNNEVYVADSRYTYNVEGDENSGFNYEWFRWTNVPVSEWFTFGNELWFGTEDGWLCKFTDGYADNTLTTLKKDGNTVAETDDGERWYIVVNKDLIPYVKNASFVYHDDKRIEIEKIEEDAGVVKIWLTDHDWYPEDEDGNPDEEAVNLRFFSAVDAYWKSAVLDLGSSIYKKNLWALSTSVMPTNKGRLVVGYKTRSKEVNNLSVQGVNAFSYDDLDFSYFSFDAGGFVNAYRKPCCAHGFVYLQLFFGSNSVGDCVVNEMAVEYSPTIKNIGVN